MDTTITGIDISKEKMINILNEILSIKLNDGVKFDIVDIRNIKEDEEYGGNKYHIVGRKDSMKISFEMDISTGDIITPKELKYSYPLLFEEKVILINCYNIETILSEKIETILRRGKFNSRMKDFYDIYYFLTKLKEEINLNHLKKAINKTLKKRDSFDYLNDYKQIINSIAENKKIRQLWEKYSVSYKYANHVELSEILKLLANCIKELNDGVESSSVTK